MDEFRRLAEITPDISPAKKGKRLRKLATFFLLPLLLILLLLKLTAFSSAQNTAQLAQDPVQLVLETAYAATKTALAPTASQPVDSLAALPTAGLPTLSLEPLPAEPPPDPLRFQFPSPAPAPVAAWRPPLYPVPWEPTKYDHFYFSRPIGADEINWPLANYRYGGVFFQNEVHTGVDIPAPLGTPVLAAGPGKIMWAGWGLQAGREDFDDPYGLAVSIRHSFGYKGETLTTVYGHMSEIFVTRGQQIEAGDPIGLVGDTGHSTGPHLHFEVRLGQNNYYTSRNPELWIAPPQGWGILAGRVMHTNEELLAEETINILSYDTGQIWEVNTYGNNGAANSDPYYRENMVIGDLPAGNYRIWIRYDGTAYTYNIRIDPGMVSYFKFQGKKGYFSDPPRPLGASFTPIPSE